MLARAARSLSVRAPVPARAVGRRFMGGGHGHGSGKPITVGPDGIKRHPDYQGFESILRAYLPHNWQIVSATLGLYGSIIFLATSGGAKPEAAPQRPDFQTEKALSSIPTLAEEPEAWADFMAESDNVEKYFESLNSSE